MDNKKVKRIIMITIVAVFLVIGISYAYLTVSITGKKTNVIKVGSLDLILDENASNGITIENGFAITDEEGLLSDGSSFSIVNNGKSNVCYELYLDDLELEEGETRVNDKFIKYSLDKENTVGKANVLTSIGENPNRILDKGKIESQKEINYQLRLWFNSEENGNYAGHVFKGRLRVVAMQCEVKKSIMKAYEYDWDDTVNDVLCEEDYHAKIYREKVTSIVTKNNTNIPDTAIEVENGKGNYFDVSEVGDNSVIAYLEDDESGNGTYKVTIGANGKIVANTDSSKLFFRFKNLKDIDLTYLNTSNVANMQEIFSSCSSLTSLNLSNFDTSNVNDMSGMFVGCSNLTSLDLSSFDTSKVINMEDIFGYCSSLTSLNLSSFDTSNVTNMGWMFEYCSNLINIDLSNFNTVNVTDMNNMFDCCSSLTILDLSSFDTSNVINMGWMFDDCGSLTSLGLRNFNTVNVTYMNNMFGGCSSLTNLDISSFNTSNVTNMDWMFSDCRSLMNIDFSNFNTSNVISMSSMFNGCSSLTNLNLTNFNTSNVNDMSGMFAYCTVLTNITVGNLWTTANADIAGMFYSCATDRVTLI